MEIIPAIMPKDLKDLKKKAALVAPYVETVQLDIMDGKFVPESDWPFSGRKLEELKELKKIKDAEFELDLMVKNAGNMLEYLVKSGAKRLIFHLEAEDSLTELFDNLESSGRGNTEVGLAINTTTDIDELFGYLSKIDFVQCMGIEEIGFQGQPFDERVLEQIERLRGEFPNATISVDGGVNLETAPQLIEAGANRLVIGSAIFGSKNIKKTIEEFKQLS